MKVAVISSQVLFRKALCAFLTRVEKFDSVIELDSVSYFVEESDKWEAQVVIIHTPDIAFGIESSYPLLQFFPEVRILFLADNPDKESGVQALETGAWGSLSTKDDPQVLIKAVGKIADGERWFDRQVTNGAIERLLAGRGANIRLAGCLSPREWEVLTLLAKGHSDKEVAASLCISAETARSHVKSIYKKLQVRTRRAAAVYYFNHIRSRSARSDEVPEVVSFSEAV